MFKIILLILVLLPSCSKYVKRESFNSIHLGMSKNEVINIMGDPWEISEKSLDNGIVSEVLDYRVNESGSEYYIISSNPDTYKLKFTDGILNKISRHEPQIHKTYITNTVPK